MYSPIIGLCRGSNRRWRCFSQFTLLLLLLDCCCEIRSTVNCITCYIQFVNVLWFNKMFMMRIPSIANKASLKHKVLQYSWLLRCEHTPFLTFCVSVINNLNLSVANEMTKFIYVIVTIVINNAKDNGKLWLCFGCRQSPSIYENSIGINTYMCEQWHKLSCKNRRRRKNR